MTPEPYMDERQEEIDRLAREQRAEMEREVMEDRLERIAAQEEPDPEPLGFLDAYDEAEEMLAQVEEAATEPDEDLEYERYREEQDW